MNGLVLEGLQYRTPRTGPVSLLAGYVPWHPPSTFTFVHQFLFLGHIPAFIAKTMTFFTSDTFHQPPFQRLSLLFRPATIAASPRSTLMAAVPGFFEDSNRPWPSFWGFTSGVNSGHLMLKQFICWVRMNCRSLNSDPSGDSSSLPQSHG